MFLPNDIKPAIPHILSRTPLAKTTSIICRVPCLRGKTLRFPRAAAEPGNNYHKNFFMNKESFCCIRPFPMLNIKYYKGGGAGMRTAGLVAAAGLSTRMGAFKPMLAWGKRPSCAMACAPCCRRGVHPVIVGHRAPGQAAGGIALSDLCRRCSACITPAMPSARCFDSVKLGPGRPGGTVRPGAFFSGRCSRLQAQKRCPLPCWRTADSCAAPCAGGNGDIQCSLPGQLIPPAAGL